MEEWIKKSDVLEMLSLPSDILAEYINELKGVWVDEDWQNDKWILCSDRLPEEDERVLITTKTMDKVYFGTHTKRYGFSMREGFICDDGFMWLNTALAWMPLPEPYKEQ